MDDPRPVLGAFSAAGFPDHHGDVEAFVAYVESGAAVLEVGTPTVDPWLDGGVIAAAHRCAIRAGHGVETTLATAQQVSAVTGKPVIVMSYWATVEAHGVERMTHALASAGAAGCLVCDVPGGQGGCLYVLRQGRGAWYAGVWGGHAARVTSGVRDS
ncbi:tryptophan synthase subunit alpha [Streptomyces griseofuscus]|uniref:tryptophan synthase subunit alpha n=1 Tax=Streptomyces griseofuscus TaxID=146922 RepID=UPI00167F8B9C|nr:tryptophan synthase subunit alpha [Streptomyces griseofuscus]